MRQAQNYKIIERNSPGGPSDSPLIPLGTKTLHLKTTRGMEETDGSIIFSENPAKDEIDNKNSKKYVL